MKSVKIGLAQVRQTDSFEANEKTISEYLERAGTAGVQILCFPEAQTVGYRADILPADAPVPVEALADLHARVANRCGELGMACILGTETPLPGDPHGGKPYNSAVVISETGKILAAHHKTRLTPLDAVAYTAGDSFGCWNLCGVETGVVICFEGFRFAETTRECVRQGAQLVFHPQNNTTRPNNWKAPIHHAMIVTRAAENTIWFASCNACLKYQNSASLIVAPDGQIHAESTPKHEELLIAEIDVDRATRAMFDFNLEGCAELLFADSVKREEYDSALPKK